MGKGDLVRPNWSLRTWRSRRMLTRGLGPTSVLEVWDTDAPPASPTCVRVRLGDQRWPEWLDKRLFVFAV